MRAPALLTGVSRTPGEMGPLAGPRSSEVIRGHWKEDSPEARLPPEPASAAGTTMDRSLAGPVQLTPC